MTNGSSNLNWATQLAKNGLWMCTYAFFVTRTSDNKLLFPFHAVSRQLLEGPPQIRALAYQHDKTDPDKPFPLILERLPTDVQSVVYARPGLVWFVTGDPAATPPTYQSHVWVSVEDVPPTAF